jgi:hypothetical protein
MMTRPRWYELSGKFAHFFQRFVVRQNRIGKVGSFVSWVAPPLAAWTAARDLRPIEDKSFRQQWREQGGSRTVRKDA